MKFNVYKSNISPITQAYFKINNSIACNLSISGPFIYKDINGGSIYIHSSCCNIVLNLSLTLASYLF